MRDRAPTLEIERARATTSSPAPTGSARNPGRARRSPRHGARERQRAAAPRRRHAARARHRRHEGRPRGHAAARRGLGAGPADHDVTFVFYEGEEVADEHNGLRHLFAEHPELVAAISRSCSNRPAGGSRPVPGHDPRPRDVRGHAGAHGPAVDGRERDPPRRAGACAIAPRSSADGRRRRARVPRVAPGRAHRAAGSPTTSCPTLRPRREPARTRRRGRSRRRSAEVEELLADADALEVLNASPAAPPNLTHPLVAELVGAGLLGVRPKLGWTDVARFAAHGIPACNFGPGDPELAHTAGERVDAGTSATAPRCSPRT